MSKKEIKQEMPNTSKKVLFVSKKEILPCGIAEVERFQ